MSHDDSPVGFGVIGARSFVANAAVLPAIEAAPNARLVATASRSGDVPQRWSDTAVDGYEAVLEHPDVDAIYIPLPNGMHREWTVRAAELGKHVLCEKPLAPDSTTARAMVDACEQAGVLLAEAWMTPFSNRYQKVLELARQEHTGRIHQIDSRFMFTIGPDATDNYRWDPQQGGGALLDVGIYCLGPIVDLFDTPDSVDVFSHTIERNVIASIFAGMKWADGRAATIQCSFIDDEVQSLDISARGGAISVDAEAFTGGTADSAIQVWQRSPRSIEMLHVDANDPYQTMIESFAGAIRGRAEWPRPPQRSIEMLQLIERIRHAAAH